ncbi:hypothetical protein pdam_00009448 [Pocillopora damicornis]|uniref:Uncharacterized protein n=1 Tax=Pocillopora damicornis TaxID=46731 RepID=A0A3M6TGD2_POCDA|nr:hypothetical protein pdam_00009448 [Pocillopora damicornis]
MSKCPTCNKEVFFGLFSQTPKRLGITNDPSWRGRMVNHTAISHVTVTCLALKGMVMVEQNPTHTTKDIKLSFLKSILVREREYSLR